MILDCHIHTNDPSIPPEEFASRLDRAGVDGGILFSLCPPSFDNEIAQPGDARKRIEQVIQYCRGLDQVHPFFFIDPMEPDALEQVDMAVEAGIHGFKAICCHHYPQDDRAMKVWSHIANAGKPLLLHSGILYNNGPSANFNRPGNFEDLILIPGLRFALAHISWPWCDELISVFGKWNYLAVESCSGVTSQMYVDVTPGTPPSYRREALSKLLQVGYPTMNSHVIFGTDGATDYRISHIQEMIARDRGIYQELEIAQPVQEQIFSKNLLDFLSPA